MSEVKQFNDFIKHLSSTTDLSEKKVLMTDTVGMLAKVLGSILNIQYSKSDGIGAAILGAAYKGVALVIVTDSGDETKMLMYLYRKSSLESSGTTMIIQSKGNLGIQATNTQGTVAINGCTSLSNVTQHIFKLA